MPLDLGEGLQIDTGCEIPREEDYKSSISRMPSGGMVVTPSKLAESLFYVMPGERFALRGREYLKEIYDTVHRETLMLFGRQSEKTVWKGTMVLMADGSERAIEDVKVGDRVVSLAPDGASTVPGIVSWKSSCYTKPCRRVRTRQGHTAVMGVTHPVRQWSRWTATGDLCVGDRVAVIRRAGEFVGTHRPSDPLVEFVAFMIGDGSTSSQPSFTQARGSAVHKRFMRIIQDAGWSFRVYKKGLSISDDIKMSGKRPRLILRDSDLLGHKAGTKRVPGWVWRLDRRQTALFINRLWSTDGSAKPHGVLGRIYDIVYGTISAALASDVQRLLWKFGIPSRIRTQIPKVYRGTDKRSYLVRVETQDGVKQFLSEIGALGKTEDLPLPDVEERNNLDTYPPEILSDLQGIYERTKPEYGSTAHASGLHWPLKYAPTKRKLNLVLKYFREIHANTESVDSHLCRDLFWDRIEEITDVGVQECYDITVEGTSSFVANGIMTHNSTTLGNKNLIYSILFRGARLLYVTPSDRQTKTFSLERVRSVVLNSPALHAFARPIDLSVYDQKFTTGSIIKLRSCYLSADRVRGERADIVTIDEYQDILIENVPVIRECAFHANKQWLRFLFGGTPKTMDNPIERLWQRTTMTELMFPCRAHGDSRKPWTWFWFPATVDCIGKTGLICPKCGRDINHMDPYASWIDTASKPKERRVKGYHVPQIITPMAHEVSEDGKMNGWDQLIWKYENYPRGKFMNEVMGVSFDYGTKPLDGHDLVACQQAGWTMNPEQLTQMMNLSSSHPMWAGVDWRGEMAYTVITLSTYCGSPDPKKLFQFYWHRFAGKEEDSETQLERIYDLLRAFNVRLTIADYGMGQHQNSWLVKRLGPKRYLTMQYVGKQNAKIVWRSKLQRFTAYKTAACTDYINAIKMGKILLPEWGTFRDPFGQDMMNLRAEYNERRDETVYGSGSDTTVDSFHSGLYSMMASLRDHPRPDITHIIVDDSVADPLILSEV